MGTDQTIRICHLASGDLWAGAEAQVYTLLAALSHRDGLELSVIILNKGTLSRKLAELGFDVTIVDESEHGLLEIRRRLKKHLTARQIDILHSHRYKENILAAVLKHRAGIPYLVQTVHGLGEPFTGLKRLKADLYMLANRHLTRKRFDRVLPVSYDIARRIRDWVGAGCLTTVHNAIDLTTIKVGRDASEIRRELGIDEEDILIGSIGRMVPVKGFDLFLQAAELMHRKRPQVRFLLAGDGPELPSLKDAACQLGLESALVFTGFRDDPIDVINALDLFVISSYHEGIPTAVLEAMALGKPVVATEVGGLPEIIDDGIHGLLVQPGQVEAMVDAWLKVLDQADLRQQIESAAPARIREEFVSEVQAEKVYAVYRALV